MRSTLLIVVWLVAFIFNSSAIAKQSSSEKDSLLRFISDHKLRDTVRVNALIDVQTYFLVDEHAKGKEYIDEAIEISRDIDYKNGLGFSLNSLGAYYLRKGEVDSALASTLEAIEIFESINENQNIYAAYNNLALIYKTSGDYDRAISTYEEMLRLLEGREKTPSFAIIYFNIAAIYEAQLNWIKFEEWILKMLNLSIDLNFQHGIKEANLGLAKVAIYNQEFDEALSKIAVVLNDIDRTGGLAQIEARSYALRGDVYSHMQIPQLAISNYQKSADIYKLVNSPRYATELFLKISDQFVKLNDFEKALEQRDLYHLNKDSLMSVEKVAVIEELQTKYETERFQREKESAELENLRLQDDNRKSRNLLFGSFGFIAFIMVFGFVINRQKKLEQSNKLREVELKETRKRLEAEQKKRIAELKAVRSQLNPHFLFNLMNTVQELNMSGDAEGANEVLTLVSRLMGMTLKNSEHEYISLDQELLLVETYLEAEKIRFGEKISFDICIDEEVETEFISIPPMLIQPYVENAIKHGLMHKKTPGNVLIKIKERDNKWLQIIVEDDGIGRKAASEISLSNADQHNGFSTKANEQRILNLNQESNQKGSVRICDSNENGTGTKVTIELPLELPLELLLTKV